MMKNARVFALRLLIGWWMIPFMWTIAWFLAWLMFGFDDANELCMDASRVFWFGDA